MTGPDSFAVGCIGVAWLAWGALWAMLAPGTKKVVRRESRRAQLSHLVPSALALGLMMAPLKFVPLLHAPVLPRAAWMAPAGALVVVAGLLFAVWARLGLGRNWSGLVTVQQSHVLVRTGAYRLVRHPIYSGLLLALIGNVVAIDAWRGMLAIALVLWAVQRRVRQEEAFMIETFGGDYESYRGETAAVIPFIW
jgi:protein-S-isoprenylcysteine O-methyltransferase Ste14